MIPTTAQEDGIYQRLPTMCTLSVTALEECALRLKPCRIYRLFVGARLTPYAGLVLKHIGALTQDNPFAPYINLTESARLEPQEWYLQGDGREAWGSEGL
jgi:hypothetical protein